jgi:hypothetical protein
MPDKTPEERLEEKIDDATEHAAKSLAQYATRTKSAVRYLSSPDEVDGSTVFKDLTFIWAQMVKDTAYGWLTAYNMAQDVSEIVPRAGEPDA